ncbi:hypothetical protein ACS0TY_001254 [Phlomoides rotata]
MVPVATIFSHLFQQLLLPIQSLSLSSQPSPLAVITPVSEHAILSQGTPLVSSSLVSCESDSSGLVECRPMVQAPVERSGTGRRGGLGLLWKAAGGISIRSFSLHHIDAMVEDDVPWRFTGVYGFPEDDQKWKTWRFLNRLGEGYSGPWLCAGDFNEILYGSEKVGGLPRSASRMLAFQNCIEDCGLVDLGFVGHAYTWSNKQVNSRNIQERLDRGLASDLWISRFPSYRVTHLTRLLSDHCPVWIEWEHPQCTNEHRTKPFRFESLWLGEEAVSDIISDV